MKYSAQLRRKTSLRPILKNETRWSSTFEMTQRYFRLKEFIDIYDEGLRDFIFSVAEEFQLQTVSEKLKDFESVSKHLQKDAANMGEARALFDSLLDVHPDLNRYLGSGLGMRATDTIVHSTIFESAVSKVCNGESLVAEELAEIQSVILPDLTVVENEGLSFSEKCLRAKRQKIDKKFNDFSWIPCTSNRVERLFSVVRGIFTDYRKKLSPVNLEAQVFLHVNAGYWDVSTVAAILNKD